MKYRKKPVVIHAREFTEKNVTELSDWCGGIPSLSGGMLRIRIDTLEGPMFANVGDFIICGVACEYYPCKPDIFHRTYKRVSA